MDLGQQIKAIADYGDQVNQVLLSSTAMDIIPLVFNLFVGLLLSLLLRWHFSRYGSTLSNREEFGSIFPMVILTIVLIISVVKSSLALALGLVGALSIVRFRTPIKEPEELSYLFLAIGIGLALGAGQTIAAIIAAPFIMACVTYSRRWRKDQTESGLFLSLDWKPNKTEGAVGDWLKAMEVAILNHVNGCDLRRFEDREGTVEALYYIDVANSEHLSRLTSDLKKAFSGIGISFLDQKNVSGF